MFQKLLCNPAPTFLQGHACLKHVARLSFNAVPIIPNGCEGIGWGGEGCYPHSVNVWYHVSHHLLHHSGYGIITDARPVPRVWSVHQPAG